MCARICRNYVEEKSFIKSTERTSGRINKF